MTHTMYFGRTTVNRPTTGGCLCRDGARSSGTAAWYIPYE